MAPLACTPAHSHGHDRRGAIRCGFPHRAWHRTGHRTGRRKGCQTVAGLASGLAAAVAATAAAPARLKPAGACGLFGCWCGAVFRAPGRTATPAGVDRAGSGAGRQLGAVFLAAVGAVAGAVADADHRRVCLRRVAGEPVGRPPARPDRRGGNCHRPDRADCLPPRRPPLPAHRYSGRRPRPCWPAAGADQMAGQRQQRCKRDAGGWHDSPAGAAGSLAADVAASTPAGHPRRLRFPTAGLFSRAVGLWLQPRRPGGDR